MTGGSVTPGADRQGSEHSPSCRLGGGKKKKKEGGEKKKGGEKKEGGGGHYSSSVEDEKRLTDDSTDVLIWDWLGCTIFKERTG